MIFFEDVIAGETTELGEHAFTAEEIKRFAGAFDPQRFHLDEVDAEASHFGRLCASGWHTGAVCMRLFVRARDRRLAKLAPGSRQPKIGPSPGFEEMRWMKPVYAGDTVTFTSTIIGKRESRSRPDWGLVSHRNEGRNQAGELVFSFVGNAFVERRQAAAPAGLNGPETPPAS